MLAGEALRALEVLRTEERNAAGPRLEWRRELQPLLREVFEHESAELSFAPELYDPLSIDRCGHWADVARGCWYWATTYGQHVFVRRCALASGRVQSVCAVKTPEPLKHLELVASGGLLALAGLSGAMLVLDGESWDIVDWREPAYSARGEIVERRCGRRWTISSRRDWSSRRPGRRAWRRCAGD